MYSRSSLSETSPSSSLSSNYLNNHLQNPNHLHRNQNHRRNLLAMFQNLLPCRRSFRRSPCDHCAGTSVEDGKLIKSQLRLHNYGKRDNNYEARSRKLKEHLPRSTSFVGSRWACPPTHWPACLHGSPRPRMAPRDYIFAPSCPAPWPSASTVPLGRPSSNLCRPAGTPRDHRSNWGEGREMGEEGVNKLPFPCAC